MGSRPLLSGHDRLDTRSRSAARLVKKRHLTDPGQFKEMIIDERRALRASATASAASINILSRGCEAGLNPLTLRRSLYAGAGVGRDLGIGIGFGVGVGLGVDEGCGVAVGAGVDVAVGVAVGVAVAVVLRLAYGRRYRRSRCGSSSIAVAVAVAVGVGAGVGVPAGIPSKNHQQSQPDRHR